MSATGEILLEKRYDGMSAADAHLQRISDHVSAYLQIVRSQLLATVPKAVVHCTVVPAKENLLAELQEEVAGEAYCWSLGSCYQECEPQSLAGVRAPALLWSSRRVFMSCLLNLC
eukprot:GHUV01046607.1.p1 GENE.GHUV01046607.1~~GHUV01046607.1.p1  ORF type:complete len:115 (-),score=30.35 GHUV01046607.1:73-417(-)